MAEVTREATIQVPVEAAFRFVADPYNAPRYISSITAITSGPHGIASTGQTWQAEASFLGQRRFVRLLSNEIRPPHLVRFSMDGQPPVTLLLRLTAKGENTQVHLALEVQGVPAIFVNSLMSGLLSGDLARLKQILEAE